MPPCPDLSGKTVAHIIGKTGLLSGFSQKPDLAIYPM
jgi:hypothetical protein